MAQSLESHSFKYFLESGIYTQNSRSVIERILATVPNDSKLISDRRLAISGFPETGRFMWLMPMLDGQTAVIEAPGDDPAPYTMLSALTSSELWRWARVRSPRYEKKVGSMCSTYNIPLPQDPDAFKPATFIFPADWINTKGTSRTGMQIHCILSRSPIASSLRLDPPKARGALCSCLPHPQSSNKPASEGCAFISRSSHFDGRTFSDGLANLAFGNSDGAGSAETIFNFTDPIFNNAAYDSYGDKTILVLLHAFTSILRSQSDRPIETTIEV